MTRGVNKVILIGNLGQDPEVKYLPDGKAVANISVATSESWTDKNSGQKQERVEWHRVVFFGRLAEVVGEYMRKGSKAYIEGSLRTRKWTDQSGQDRYTTEIVGSELQMLDSAGGDQQQNQQQSYQQPQQPQQQPQQQPYQQQQQPQQQYQQSQQGGYQKAKQPPY